MHLDGSARFVRLKRTIPFIRFVVGRCLTVHENATYTSIDVDETGGFQCLVLRQVQIYVNGSKGDEWDGVIGDFRSAC